MTHDRRKIFGISDVRKDLVISYGPLLCHQGFWGGLSSTEVISGRSQNRLHGAGGWLDHDAVPIYRTAVGMGRGGIGERHRPPARTAFEVAAARSSEISDKLTYRATADLLSAPPLRPGHQLVCRRQVQRQPLRPDCLRPERPPGTLDTFGMQRTISSSTRKECPRPHLLDRSARFIPAAVTF